MSKPDYDTTLARMAGNIAANYVNADFTNSDEKIAEWSVALARAIAAEVKRTSQPPSEAAQDGKEQPACWPPAGEE